MKENIEYIEHKEEQNQPKNNIITIAHRMNQYSFLLLAWIGILLGLGSESYFFFVLTAILTLFYFGSMMIVASYLIGTQTKK